MPSVRANGISIEYDEFGDPDSPPLLLIMGLGGQMVAWDETLCNQLAGRGFRVIRFDNRDTGLSTKFDDICPQPAQLIVAHLQGKSVEPPYTLDDMAQDTIGLLQALAIPSAHLVGASMGGMIAQTLAIQHPQCARTLTSIMSTTSRPGLPQAKPEVHAILMQPVPTEYNARIDHAVVIWRALAGPGFEFDEARVRERAALAYERDPEPTGTARQLLAIMTASSRKDALRSLTIPTLVIHGDADPLIPIAGGFDTAEAIPGAEMIVIEGMGHELPEATWPRITDAIVRLTERAA